MSPPGPGDPDRATRHRREERATGSQVHYVQTGGFAGLRFVAEVDTSSLEPGEAAELEGLIDAALAAPPAGPADERVRDDQQYEVTIIRQGRTSVLRSSDTAISGPVAALVERVRPHARPTR